MRPHRDHRSRADQSRGDAPRAGPDREPARPRALERTGPLQAGAEALGRIAGVQQVDVADGTIDVLVEQAGNTLMALLSALTEAGVSIIGVEIDEPNLEAVFLHLTGRSLRD